MRVVKTSFMLGVIGVLGVGWLFAQQRTPTGRISPEDYMDIMQLYAYYTRDVDPGAVRDASWLYVPDGMIEYRVQTPGGGTRVASGAKGAAELKAFYMRLLKTQSFGTRHLNSNHLVEWTPEGANSTVVMTQIDKKDVNKPPAVVQIAVYHDKLVKTPDGWKFKVRLLTRDGLYPE